MRSQEHQLMRVLTVDVERLQPQRLGIAMRAIEIARFGRSARPPLVHDHGVVPSSEPLREADRLGGAD